MAISCMTYHQWAGPLVPRGHGPRPREAQWVNLKVFDIEGPSFEQGPCLSIPFHYKEECTKGRFLGVKVNR